MNTLAVSSRTWDSSTTLLGLYKWQEHCGHLLRCDDFTTQCYLDPCHEGLRLWAGMLSLESIAKLAPLGMSCGGSHLMTGPVGGTTGPGLGGPAPDHTEGQGSSRDVCGVSRGGLRAYTVA